MRRLEEPEQGFFAISSPRTESITKHGRLGKLHGVPALAGRDRLKVGLSYEGSSGATNPRRAPVRETEVTLPGPSAGRGRGCRSAAIPLSQSLKRKAVRVTGNNASFNVRRVVLTGAIRVAPIESGT